MRLSIDNSLLQVLSELFFWRVKGVETVKKQNFSKILVYIFSGGVDGGGGGGVGFVLEGELEILGFGMYRIQAQIDRRIQMAFK